MSAAPARAAATLAVLRDAAHGPEVLLLRRAERGDHNSGAWVFPGGLVDASDRECHADCADLDDVRASRLLGLPHGGLDYFIAALRESFEEAGLLFATTATGAAASGDDAQAADWRDALNRRDGTLHQCCEATGWRLVPGALAYLSHWLTPLGRAKRFDTRFFVARVPAGQSARHDAGEAVEQRWLRPADALALTDELRLLTPTLKTLELLARFDSTETALAWARTPRTVPLVMPWIGHGRDGIRPVTPDEPAWAELARIDPQGHGHGCYDIRPGEAVRLSPHVLRVTAPNPGLMTGPGTNTYLVGGGPGDEWSAIDPGPDSAAHAAAILAAAPGPIRRILVTHTHLDHSPGWARLAAATGARVIGRRPTAAQGQDESFRPDEEPRHGQRFALDQGITLRALHTPGHASNHVCWLLEEERTLFTGDQVMQRSTVVINPPDGNMAAYLASLRALAELPLDWLAPGHGFLMREPRRAIEAIIAHRERREAKVLKALRALAPVSPEDLLASVYDDVPEALHHAASRSLLAHLFKLRDEGFAAESGGRWLAA